MSALISVPIVSLAEETNEASFDLSLQELLDVEVTSVSKQRQALSSSPAAVYVLTNEDIMRSGATSIPQALRDVPGLHVVQIDSQKWAVSSRGFNGRYNNKLLVMMDGRTLYSPEFSGVNWEFQDTLMADIERIEIIRGSNAAIWGANAVNGVINIITKHSADTLGGYAELGVGDYEQGFAGFRYGGQLADGVTARAYAKGFERDSLQHNAQDMDSNQHILMMGVETNNDWNEIQAGGRVDIAIDSTSALAISTDIYDSNMGQLYQVASSTAPYQEFIHDSFDNRGWNVVAKYTKALSGSSQYSFQTYYDYVDSNADLFGFTTDTIDFEFQHQFTAWQSHSFVWGLGYRHIKDEVVTHPTITTEYSRTKTNLWSGFIRDEITLLDDQLWLTLASRFEHNSYTGFEVQPNIRLMWQLNEQHKLWSSIAYAVRTPSRAENNFIINASTIPPFTPNLNPSNLPIKILVKGNDDYDSEEILTYEVGYRFTPSNNLSFDSTIFYNDYDSLRGANFGTLDDSNVVYAGGFPVAGYFNQPTSFNNNLSGHNYGFELSSQWLATNTLRLKLNYGYVSSNFEDGQTQNTVSPEHILSAHADWSITNTLNFNLTWRYVDNTQIIDTSSVNDKQLDSFHGLDLGLNWQLVPDVSLSVYGKNLLYPSHVEYEAEQYHIPYRVEPSYFAKITLAF